MPFLPPTNTSEDIGHSVFFFRDTITSLYLTKVIPQGSGDQHYIAMFKLTFS